MCPSTNRLLSCGFIMVSEARMRTQGTILYVGDVVSYQMQGTPCPTSAWQ